MDWSPRSRTSNPSIADGLESAKPDVQSAFKKPGGDPAALDYGKCFTTGERKEGSRRG